MRPTVDQSCTPVLLQDTVHFGAHTQRGSAEPSLYFAMAKA